MAIANIGLFANKELTNKELTNSFTHKMSAMVPMTPEGAVDVVANPVDALVGQARKGYAINGKDANRIAVDVLETLSAGVVSAIKGVDVVKAIELERAEELENQAPRNTPFG